MRITAGCSSQLDLAFVLSKQNWHCVGGWRWWWGSCYFNCGCCRIWFNTLIIIAHCCSRSTPFYLLFWQNFQTKWRWNHLVLEMEILIDQNQGCYIIPNMFAPLCRYFITTWFLFLHSKSMTFSCGLLEWIYTTTRLIYPNFQGSNLIAFQGSKIIVDMILEPSTAPQGGF